MKSEEVVPPTPVAVKIGDYTLNEMQVENLAHEFIGKVLSAAGSGITSEMNLEFIDPDYAKGFRRALLCFTKSVN